VAEGQARGGVHGAWEVEAEFRKPTSSVPLGLHFTVSGFTVYSVGGFRLHPPPRHIYEYGHICIFIYMCGAWEVEADWRARAAAAVCPKPETSNPKT